MCDEGFGPSTGALLPPGLAEKDIGGIGSLLDEASEDLLPRNDETVTSEVISADVHQPDEATLPPQPEMCQ
jgi:hypothetical protein